MFGALVQYFLYTTNVISFHLFSSVPVGSEREEPQRDYGGPFLICLPVIFFLTSQTPPNGAQAHSKATVGPPVVPADACRTREHLSTRRLLTKYQSSACTYTTRFGPPSPNPTTPLQRTHTHTIPQSYHHRQHHSAQTWAAFLLLNTTHLATAAKAAPHRGSAAVAAARAAARLAADPQTLRNNDTNPPRRRTTETNRNTNAFSKRMSSSSRPLPPRRAAASPAPTWIPSTARPWAAARRAPKTSGPSRTTPRSLTTRPSSL
jgi:hypothetical protein